MDTDQETNFSLARRLPSDILSQIFIHTLGSSGTLKLPLRHNDCPWALRRVCSLWRLVALRETRLWNNISIQLEPNHSPEDYAYVREILPPHGPLSITLFSNGYVLEDDVFKELVQLNLSRVIKLHLDVQLLPTSKFWTLPPASLPAIEELHLPLLDAALYLEDEEGFFFTRLPPKDIRFFQGMSRLKKLSVQTTEIADFTILEVPFVPWSQLKYIDLVDSNPLHIHAIRQILMQCPAVESFAVGVVNELHDFSVPDSDTLLPSLTCLYLTGGTLGHYLHLRLPWRQLKYLNVSGSNDDGSILTILRHALCIETLAVSLYNNPTLSADGLEHPIVCEHLNTLMLDNHDIQFLASVTMPRLKKLSISACARVGHFDKGNPRFKPRMIVDFIQKSKCSLIVFEYGFYISEENLDILLPSLAPLHEWRVRNGLLGGAGVSEKIRQGALLPELRVFDTGFRSPEEYFQLLKSRVRLPQHSLRTGIGYFCPPPGQKGPIPRDVVGRLDDLNAEFGIEFTIAGPENDWGQAPWGLVDRFRQ